MKIRTEHVFPPIPDRRFDWSAVDDDTYDAEIGADGVARSSSPIGYGPTEEAAIADLMEQIEERRGDSQKSFLPPPTTQEQIAAEAAKKRGGNEPADFGLFGSEHKQTDLIDEIHRRERWEKNREDAPGKW